MSSYGEETWAPIPGFPGYSASSWGEVRSEDRKVWNSRGFYFRLKGKTLSPTVMKSGHLRVKLGRTPVLVHRAVALAHLPNPDSLPMVLHWDDNPGNNFVDNLRWGSRSENSEDAIRNGKRTYVRPERCKYGHEFTSENLYSYGTQRQCKECRRRRDKERNA